MASTVQAGLWNPAMAKEIERKFLVAGGGWKAEATRARAICQAYLATTQAAAVRIRIVESAEAWLTIKSARPGMVRDEFEYAVPVADAEAMLELRSGCLIEKVRHDLPCADGRLVVDAFSGANAGLVIAEIELGSTTVEPRLPGWIGPEITEDRRFYNASLSARPLSDWTAAERAGVLGPAA